VKLDATFHVDTFSYIFFFSSSCASAEEAEALACLDALQFLSRMQCEFAVVLLCVRCRLRIH
jgi:hypothetical protein